MQSFLFCRWDLVCRPHFPSEDRGTGDKNRGDFHCTQMSLMMSMRYIFSDDWKFGNDVILLEWIDFRVIMHDMQALIKKEISPSRMRKYYGGKILFCGVLRHYVSQNIVGITFRNLWLNRFTLFYVFNW